MENNGEIMALAEAVMGLFEERYGEFRAEDFAMVEEELGFEVKASEAAEEPEYTDHSEKQPGEGFWAMAPGAGGICEGLVSVSKKPIAENYFPDIIGTSLEYAVEAYVWKTHIPRPRRAKLCRAFGIEGRVTNSRKAMKWSRKVAS